MTGLILATAHAASDLPALVCIDIAIIIVAARTMGVLFRKFGQPAVVGEIVAGILLGPTLLGAFPGHPDAVLFPADALAALQVLAQLGVVLFMFIIGLEVDLGLVRGRERVAGTVSLASVALPFGLGILLAFYLYGIYGGSGTHAVSKLGFALFIGASMSVTAFPVLARILAERRMMTTDLGAFALACAAVDDVTAWTLLAVVVGLVQSNHPLVQLPVMLAELAAFAVVVFVVVRPFLRWMIDRDKGTVSITLLATILVGVLVSAWVTDRIGIHLIFGAFIFGAAVPTEGRERVVAQIVDRVESVTLVLLLPIFFVVAGLSVNIRTIGTQGLGALVLILLVAVGGKFAGAAAASRLQGVTTRRSLALGTLMNTRGLTELIILTVGLSLGVIPPQLFTLLVIMAVVTTMMTGPLFKAVYPDRMLQADIEEDQRKLSHGASYRALVVLDDPGNDQPLFDCAADLVGPDGEVLLVCFLARSGADGPYSGVSGDLIDMTAAMERLGAIARSRADIAVRPISQFSGDPLADLSDLAHRAEVDVILRGFRASLDPEELDQLRGRSACDVVVLRPGARPDHRAVTVVVARQSEAGAALELGVRMDIHRAMHDGGDNPEGLRLTPHASLDSGRCRRIAERLSSIGIADAAVSEDGGRPADGDDLGLWPHLVIGPTGDLSDGTELGTLGSAADWLGSVSFVYGYDDPQRVGIDQRFTRLARVNKSERSVRRDTEDVEVVADD